MVCWSKALIAVPVEGQSLKQMLRLKDAITAALENFNSIIKALNKATGEPLQEIVATLIQLSTSVFVIPRTRTSGRPRGILIF
jgi:hypothetical protein